MKRVLVLLLLVGNITFGYAQYSKEKITDILTGGSSKSWTAKAASGERPEKGFTFDKNMTVQVQRAEKGGGNVQTEKWSLSSKDNIRWTIAIGNQTYEIIVSYDKAGTQYVKLTHKPDAGKTTGGFELTLYGAR